MFALRLDVSNDIVQLALTHGEGAIVILPGKGTPSKRFVEPQTRSALSNCTALLMENVGGIEPPDAHGHRCHRSLLERCHCFVRCRLDIPRHGVFDGLTNQGLAVLGGKDNVIVKGGVGVWHDCASNWWGLPGLHREIIASLTRRGRFAKIAFQGMNPLATFKASLRDA